MLLSYYQHLLGLFPSLSFLSLFHVRFQLLLSSSCCRLPFFLCSILFPSPVLSHTPTRFYMFGQAWCISSQHTTPHSTRFLSCCDFLLRTFVTKVPFIICFSLSFLFCLQFGLVFLSFCFVFLAFLQSLGTTCQIPFNQHSFTIWQCTYRSIVTLFFH